MDGETIKILLWMLGGGAIVCVAIIAIVVTFGEE